MSTPHDTDYTVAICGAGPVGLALAAMLARRGMDPARIGLFDAKALAHSAQDPRAIAVSYGSRQILEQLGAWPLAATAIRQIHVSRRGSFGRTLIDSADMQVPALGYVCRYGVLVTALAQAASDAGIHAIRPAQVGNIEQATPNVQLHWTQLDTDTTQQASAGIVVQAEGALFSEQHAKQQSHDYGQTAITALVHVSAPIAQRAFERFTDQGPLALLPQDDGYALVWCTDPVTATALLALPDADFLAALTQAFGQRLGQFTATSKRHAFALGLNADSAPPAPASRLIAIGNAAQTLHPVAGQGFNLGLRDAVTLARLLAQDASPDMLQQFHRARQADRRLTIGLTHSMARIFAASPEGSPLQTLLGGALGLLDAVTPAKRLLAETMMFGRR